MRRNAGRCAVLSPQRPMFSPGYCHGIPEENRDQAAQIYVDALAERDAMTVEDAARAAGARTPAEFHRVCDLIREQRGAHG